MDHLHERLDDLEQQVQICTSRAILSNGSCAGGAASPVASPCSGSVGHDLPGRRTMRKPSRGWPTGWPPWRSSS